MKVYANGKKASEISKADLAPIYKAAKSGELKVEKWFMSELYNLADYYGYDDNRSMEWSESQVRRMLAEEDRQAAINELTEKWFRELSNKNKKAADRSFVA